MGRKKVPLNPWETARIAGDDGHYIRLGDSFLESKAVQQLSRSTFFVLLQMIKACAGKRSFTFPRSYFEKHCGLSHITVVRAVKELQARGFIEKQLKERRRLRDPNTYTWSFDWKKNNS